MFEIKKCSNFKIIYIFEKTISKNFKFLEKEIVPI
jgi:hypothetical protein